MLHNDSNKHESIFTPVTIQENKSVMLSTSGATLEFGITWRRKIQPTRTRRNYNIVGKYGYDSYPANPNGSDYNTMLCDTTGRHLVMMPHIERLLSSGTGLIIQLVETMRFRHEAFVNALWIEKVILLIYHSESAPEKGALLYYKFKDRWIL
jgi:phosphoribosylformylglycinamidine synthase